LAKPELGAEKHSQIWVNLMNLPPKMNEGLVEKAEKLAYLESIRLFCQKHNILFDENADVLKIVK
jgi:hypothetical protein